MTDVAKDHVAFSKHNQTCIDTYLAFFAFLLSPNLYTVEQLQSKRKQIKFDGCAYDGLSEWTTISGFL